MLAPEPFNKKINHISGMRQLCAITADSQLGCWDPETKIFDEVMEN